jgi:DNA-binding transcriptional LysR family regulator
MLDINKLHIFIEAADTQSCTETAQRLHLSQPTVSKHIRSLESELGTVLFERTSEGLRLTNAGKTLLPWARKLVRDSIGLKSMMQALDQDISGQLTIACSTTAGKYILPQLAARFRVLHPGTQISIHACMPEHVSLELMKQDADLGVVSREVCLPEMECQPFFDDRITLIVPFHHRWATRPFIEPEELLEEPLILREPTSGTRRVMLEELAKYDITLDDLNVFLELGNAEAIVRTVANGYGVSFVSTLASACPLQRGDVVDVPVKGVHLRRKIYMIRKSLEVTSRHQDAFWSFIHDPGNADLLKLPSTLE